MRNNIKNSVAGLVLGVVSRIRAERGKATAQRRWLLASLFAILTISPGVMAQDERPLEGQTRKPVAVSAPTVTATATTDRVRFVAPGTVVQLRLEVYTESGQKVFDTELRGGNVLDWHLQDGAGVRLASGSYACVLTIKSLSGKISQRTGLVTVQDKKTAMHTDKAMQLSSAQQQAIGPVEGNAGFTVLRESKEAMTAVTHDGTEGQLSRTGGALSFRVGDFFSGKDAEQMRLTADGKLGLGTADPQAKLDVAGDIRATGTIRAERVEFPDGSVQTSGQNGRVDEQGNAIANATGTGTQNYIAKWLDNAGTLGDSIITESAAGNIGIGTPTPAFKLDIVTAANSYGWRATDGTVITGLYNGSGGGWVGTSSNHPFHLFSNNSGARFTIATSGNVGIGTTNPIAPLTVQSSGDPMLLINHTGTSGNPALWFQQDGITKAYMWWDRTGNRLNLGTPTTNPIISFSNNGRITIPPATRYKSIHGAAFMFYRQVQGSVGSVDPEFRYDERFLSGDYTYSDLNNYPVWTASVELPDGAVVTEFCLSAAAYDANYPNISANLYKTDLNTGGTALIARTFTAAGSTAVQNVCINSNELVDNNRYTYSVKIHMERGRLIGVRLKYQVTQLP